LYFVDRQMDRDDPSEQDGHADGQEEQQGHLEIVSEHLTVVVRIRTSD
jgi:hypothetical protein